MNGANAKVIKEREATRKANEEAPLVVKEIPIIVQDIENDDTLTTKVDRRLCCNIESMSHHTLHGSLLKQIGAIRGTCKYFLPKKQMAGPEGTDDREETPPPLTKEQIEGHVSALKSLIKSHNRKNKGDPIRLDFKTKDTKVQDHNIVKGNEVIDEDLKKPFNKSRRTPFTRRIIEFAGEWPMPVWCRMFQQTLDGSARRWFERLPPDNINEWADPREAFAARFSVRRACFKEPHEITTIIRRANESLTAFKERWTVETGFIMGAPEVMKISSFMDSIKSPELAKHFSDKFPTTLNEMMERLDNFVWSEEAYASTEHPKGVTGESHRKISFPSNGKDVWPLRNTRSMESRRDDYRNRHRGRDTYHANRPRDGRAPHPPPRGEYNRRVASVLALDSLTKRPKEILATETQLRLSIPRPMLNPLRSRNADRYCDYHQEKGHYTYDYKGRIERNPNGSGRVRRRSIEATRKDRAGGRPGLKTLRAIPSTIHAMMKFPTPKGVATLVTRTVIIVECRRSTMTDHRARAECESFLGSRVPKTENIFNGKKWGACSKDYYPLPNIDCKVESVTGFKYKCFLDAYKGYHQIQMAKEDEEKMAFHTDQGMYYYTKMSFSLKNAGVTYQRLVDSTFRSQVGRNLEAYMDDMVIKSRDEKMLLADVSETFDNLKKINIKLNPKRCSFGVEEGKFLGYMVTSEGIRANPRKIKALTDLQSPRTLKEMQSLSGELVALNRFLAKSAERSLPFFNTLKNITKENKHEYRWTQEVERAFQQIKKLITDLPSLTPPRVKETLYAYLAVSAEAISVVLLTDRKGRQCPVQYVSRTLNETEKNYAPIEKLALTLIHMTRRLRRYLGSHPIKVITDQPIKNILNNTETSGKLVKYVVELGAYNITFIPCNAVKGQVLADFLSEVSEGEKEELYF
nr:reverse transcriptase domain-containing protein [Tanacetum cinerariifolium]